MRVIISARPREIGKLARAIVAARGHNTHIALPHLAERELMGAGASAGLGIEEEYGTSVPASRRTVYVASTSSDSSDKGNDAELVATINTANTAASNLALESARLAAARAQVQEATSGRVQAQKDVVMHRQKEQLHLEQLAAARAHLRVYNQVRGKVTMMAPKHGKAKKGKGKKHKGGKGKKGEEGEAEHTDGAPDKGGEHEAHESEDATKGKKGKGKGKKKPKKSKKKGADEREEERAGIEDEAAAGVDKYKQRIVQHEAKIKEHKEGRIAAEQYLGNSNAQVLAARRTCKVTQMAHDSGQRSATVSLPRHARGLG